MPLWSTSCTWTVEKSKNIPTTCTAPEATAGAKIWWWASLSTCTATFTMRQLVDFAEAVGRSRSRAPDGDPGMRPDFRWHVRATGPSGSRDWRLIRGSSSSTFMAGHDECPQTTTERHAELVDGEFECGVD